MPPMKKYLNIVLWGMIFLLPAFTLAQVGPIFDETKDCSPGTNFLPRYCTLCNLLAVIQKAVKYFLLLLIPVAAIVIIYGGFQIMFAGASPSGIAKGRSTIYAAIIGIAIAFGSWLIVNEVITFLANGKPSGTPWNEIICKSGVPPVITEPPAPPPIDTGGVTPPTAEEKGLASIVLNAGVCGGSKSCGGVGACDTLKEVAAGKPPPVCFSGCETSSLCVAKPNIHLSTDMLTAIDGLKRDGLSFIVSSITTGSHSATSKHYQGKAVDFVTKPGGTTYAQLEAKIKENPRLSFWQCEDLKSVKVPCSSSAAAHLHAEFK